MDASLQQRAQWRPQQQRSAAADDEWDDDADNDAESPSNLFTAFHAGLKELFAPTPSSSSSAPTGGADVADNGAGGDNSKPPDEAEDEEEHNDDEDDRISGSDDSAYDDDDTDVSEIDDEQKNEEAPSDEEDDEEEEDGGSTNRSRHSAASSPPRRRRPSRRSDPPRLHVSDDAAASIASNASADSTSAAAVASALPPLTSSEKEQLSIFFMPPDDFDAVHPLFKPMPEPPLQPLLLLPADSAKSTTVAVDASPHQSRGAASSGASRGISAPGSPRTRPSVEPVATAANLATDLSPCGPRLVLSLSASLAPSSAIAVLPAVLRRDVHTEAACADPGRVRGRDAVRYEAADQEQEENGGPQPSKPASNLNAHHPSATLPSDGGASVFLGSVPLCRSLSSLHRLSELLLFHAHFPLPPLAGVGGKSESGVLARCLVQPLLRRHEQATQSFIHHVMDTCGLHDHLSSLRELFLGGDGFLAHALCSELFAKLDAGQGEADILGLDFALQDALARHASPLLRRTLAPTLTLGLLPPPLSSAARRRATAAAAAAAAVVAGAEALLDDQPTAPLDAELPELAAPEDPQSLAGLEQLELRVTIAWPLSSIVTPESLKGYNKIWRLLLQLRRAEMALNDCALSGCSAAPHSVANRRSRAAALAGVVARPGSGGGGGAPPSSSLPSTAGRVLSRTSKYFVNANGVQHAFYLLKAELQHFLRHMLAYVLGRAAEGCWKPLLRALHKHARSGDTEQIRQLHDKYIEDILFQCMLTPKLSVALDAIKRVLGLCLDLRLLHRTVLVDYMEGQPGDYIFDPPATSSAAGGRSSSAASSSSFAWSTMTGRSTSTASSTRRGSVDLDSAAAGAGEEGSSGTGGGGGGGGTSSSFDRPPPHRICLPGVHSFAQLQVRLYETSMAQLALLRNELRQTVRFLLTLLNSIVEHGVNAQLHAVLVALQFNDFYKFDA